MNTRMESSSSIDYVIGVPSMGLRDNALIVGFLPELEKKTISTLLCVNLEEKALYEGIECPKIYYEYPEYKNLCSQRDYMLEYAADNCKDKEYMVWVDDNTQLQFMDNVKGRTFGRNTDNFLEAIEILMKECREGNYDLYGAEMADFPSFVYNKTKVAPQDMSYPNKMKPFYKVYIVNLNTYRANREKLRLGKYPEMVREDYLLEYLFWCNGHKVGVSHRVCSGIYHQNRKADEKKYNEVYPIGFYNFVKEIEKRGLPLNLLVLNKKKYNHLKKKSSANTTFLGCIVHNPIFDVNFELSKSILGSWTEFKDFTYPDFMGGKFNLDTYELYNPKRCSLNEFEK